MFSGNYEREKKLEKEIKELELFTENNKHLLESNSLKSIKNKIRNYQRELKIRREP